MNTSHVLTLASISDLPVWYYIAPVAAVVALIMAFVFSRSVMSRSEGDSEMIRIAQAVRDGAMAYLSRQYRVVLMVFIGLVLVLGVMSFGLHLQPRLSMLGVPIAGLLSGLCGWFGMKMATNASARTAAAAKESLNDGLRVAFRSGAVMGLVVVGFALLDVSVWFFVLNMLDFGSPTGSGVDLRILTTVMLSFGMGASTQALFARVGGGIYTKAADVGADLVGKVEAGIPEDDARNPATIADNVGDNVGDVAGMGADLYESYYGSILATMALGAAAAFTFSGVTRDEAATLAMQLALAPIVLAGVGILCSIIGVFTVKAKEGASFAELLKGLHKGVYVASALIIVASIGLFYVLLGQGPGSELASAAGVSWIGLSMAIVSGLVAGLIIAYATEYYTSYEHPPTRKIALQALTGPATVIIAGIAEGMKSTWAALLTVVVAIIAAFTFAGGADNFLIGLYGVGISAVGMLATLGITLATDAYGPIADNAGGNAEMTGQPPHVRQRTDMLDSLGNTTAATGKGFAIGSAALTALALFAAYVQVVQTQLTAQSISFAERNAEAITAQAPANTDGSPFVVYQGHGRFSVIGTNAEGGVYRSGGLLIERNELSTEAYNALAPLDTFSAVPVDVHGEELPMSELAEAPMLRVVGPGAEGEGPLDFHVVSTTNATISDVLDFYDVTILNPRVLGGLFIGVMLTFLFCALTMNAVGRAANEMMKEARRQFAKMREALRAQNFGEDKIADPEQWPKVIQHEGKTYPDYAECVSISTAAAQREMVRPALLAIGIPIAVGLVLNVSGVVGMLAGGLTAGFAVAIFMANAGGAWDNAKKLIESYGRISADDFMNDPAKREAVPAEIRDAIDVRATEYRAAGRGSAYVYGKGSDDHKATVVGDTVGDPFKDTSGPSLNILIKLISIVSVVFAGLIVKFGPVIGSMIGLG